MEFIIILMFIMVWDAYILTDMSNQEDMYTFHQEVIDQIADGYIEMTDIIFIITLMYHIITDQMSILTEEVHQDLMVVSIMEIEDHITILTEAFLMWEVAVVWTQVIEVLVHSSAVDADKHKKF